MYAKGQSVKSDKISGHMWLNIAATGGHKNAVKARGMVAGKMSSSDVVKAQERAKRCMAFGYKRCD